MRRSRLLLGIAALALALGVGATAFRGTPKSGVAIIGDETPALLKAAGLTQALPLHTAALTVVSVEGWFKLDYVADMHALCGAACDDPNGIVRLLDLRPRGSSRVLYINLETLPEQDRLLCAAAIIRAELADGLSDSRPDCTGETVVVDARALPGLGTFASPRP